ncbi:MAG: PqqD family protein [Leptolyngbyaceae cyanobacterium]
MSESRFFRINAPDVVSETIDGETVIINLYKGLYYNLNPVGSLIWTLIEAGTAQTAITELLQQHYPQWTEADRASVTQLCDRLIAEELIVASETSIPAATPDITVPPTFEAPVLYKYADMQDLLALDPIHDVDETGWPNQPAEVLGASNF